MNEEEKTKYFDRAEYLTKKYKVLNMVYLRVSTKTEGQQEEDQLKDILETFDLKKKECLIIRAKESAYQERRNKTRKFNIFYELIEHFKDIDKTLYLWDLDRIYRNQKRQAYFICHFADKFNCRVLSHRQKFLHQFKSMDAGFGRAMYNFMIELFGWMAEEESIKKGDRLKKSLTLEEDGRTYTNKGNLFGKKIKTITGKRIKDAKFLTKLELAIAKKIKKGMAYRDIQRLVLEKQKINISLGKLTNIKNKYL